MKGHKVFRKGHLLKGFSIKENIPEIDDKREWINLAFIITYTSAQWPHGGMSYYGSMMHKFGLNGFSAVICRMRDALVNIPERAKKMGFCLKQPCPV